MVGTNAANERKKHAFKLAIETVGWKRSNGKFAGDLEKDANFKTQRAKLVLGQMKRKVEGN